MDVAEEYSWLPVEGAWKVLDLVDAALMAQSLEELTEVLLSRFSQITQSNSAGLYIADARLPSARFFARGFAPAAAAEVEDLCVEWSCRIAERKELGPLTLPFSQSSDIKSKLILSPLRTSKSWLGLMYALAPEGQSSATLAALQGLQGILASLLDHILERTGMEEQLSHLNTYLTVSSALSQSIDLHELLEISMYCCMQAVPVEAGSILLLDDEKKNFIFYEVGGPAEPVLKSATFPADRGIAGSVLQNQQAEIINDISQDPRFYGRVDTESGFHTRNMVAIPLIAGQEKVGVLELLNKADGDPFMDEELQLLLPLTEEIAFAIRNAIVFDYVVSTYCKQRQGLATCKGCQRPLGSWTPCVKYQDVGVWNEGLSPEDTLTLPKSRS